MIKAVLFDLGGTLHVCNKTPQREIWFARRLLDRLADYGIQLPVSPETLAVQLKENAEIHKKEVERTQREMPTDRTWSEFYLRGYGIDKETIAPFSEELSFIYDYERVSNMRRPHLMETLQALRARGIRLGVISNMLSKTLVPHFILEYGLEDLMEIVLTSSGTGIRKPDPAIFRVAEEKMQLLPNEMVYVGDTLSRDVKGAKDANWRGVIQIPCASSSHRDACMKGSSYAPDAVISDLSEIPGIIDTWNREEDS